MPSSTDERVGRLALIGAAACVLVFALTAVVAASPTVRQLLDVTPSTPAAFQIGDHVPALAELGTRPIRVLVFVKSSCAASEASRSAIAQLQARVKDREDVDFLVVTSDTLADAAYAETFAAKGATRRADLGTLGLERVPAVAVVASDGNLLAFRQGRIESSGRGDVVTGALAR